MKNLYILICLLFLSITLRAQTNLLLNYDGNDQQYSTDNGYNYTGYLWNVNSHYSNTDNLTMRYAAVRFDTLQFIDINSTLSFYSRATATIVLDSFTVAFVHQHNTANPDTIRFTVFNTAAAVVTGYSLPTATFTTPPLWDTIIVANASIPLNTTYYTFATFAPHISLPQGQTFGIRADFTGDTANKFRMIAGYRDQCAGACGAEISAAGNNSSYYLNNTVNTVNTSGYYENGGVAIFYDCDQSGGFTPNACENFYVQNWWIYAYINLQPLTVSLGTNQSVCNGSYIIHNPVVTSGTPPFTYNWSSTGNTLSCYTCKHPSTTLTQNSTYYVTVIDANNQSASDTISYTFTGGNNQVQFSAANTGIDCLHVQDTTAVTVTGGISPFTFNWSDGSSVTNTSPQQHIYTQEGDYVIGVKDAGSCLTCKLDTVVYNGIFITPVQPVPPVCVNQNTGKLKVIATNGTPAYSFLWSNNAVTDSAVNIPAGNYSVTVTDATSCSASARYNLAPVDGWGYYVYLNPSATNCNNNGTITLNTQGGTPPFGFNWNTGQATQNIGNLSGGIYYVTVQDAFGCPAIGHATVPSDCYSIISGQVFIDTNANCIHNAGETAIPDMYISAVGNGQTFYGNTNANGTYTIQVSSIGNYILNTSNYYGTCGNTSMCNNPNHTVAIAVLGDTSANNNFVFANSTGYDLNIHPGWTSANPGFEKEYWIYCGNNNSIPFTGQATVTFNYDPNLIYQSSNPVASHNLDTHTLTWQLSSIASNTGFWGDQLHCSFLVPQNLGLGYLLQSDFRMIPVTGDCDSSNNVMHVSETTIGSHDPNEKKVEPAGSILEEDSMLTYTIGFQNTGTDSAHFIIIKDTLSANLEPLSVRNIASSHIYSEFNISGKGILTWIFNPLRLVDSFTNEPKSHGFVKFTVKKKSNMPIGSTISNKAHIYFDYNEPVVTNTVADTISEPNFIFEVRSEDGISVKAYPNPFSHSAHIVVEGLKEKFNFELYDVTGKLRKRISSIETSQFELQRDELSPAIYFYRIITGSGKSAYGKVVAE